MRTRTKIILLLLILAVATVWPVGTHYRAKWKVEKYNKALAARGEKLTLEAVVPKPPPGQNGAHTLYFAVGRLSLYSTNLPPVMRYIGNGRAVAGWKQPFLPSWDSTNLWPGLKEAIAENEDALAEIRAALKSQALHFELDYSAGFNALLPHLPRFRQAAQWLCADAMLGLHEGRSADALEDLAAATALVTRFSDEPFIISVQVRLAVAQSTLDAAWEALQFPDWQDEQLARLQRAWESVELLDQVEAALAMERVLGAKLFADGRESYSTIGPALRGPAASGGPGELAELGRDLVDDPGNAMKNLMRRRPGYLMWKWWWSYEDELASARMVQVSLDAVRTARHERALGPALKQFEQNAARLRQSHSRAGVWLGYPLINNAESFQRLLARTARLELQRRLLLAAIGLERSRHKYGKYPGDLAALAPEFLPEPPRDGMDGQLLRYKLNSDGSFVLYSVGEDGMDNGGDTTLAETTTERGRAWWRGRDAVWPQPASVTEAENYFRSFAERRGMRAAPVGTGAALPSAGQRTLFERYSGMPGRIVSTNIAPTNAPK